MFQLMEAWLSMMVRGHSVLPAILSAACSAASPRATSAIPSLEIMYATLPGEGLVGEARAHIQDVAPLLLHHVRQGVVARDVGGADVDPHHQVEAFGRRLQDGLQPDGAGVVDQNVEAAELLDGALDQSADGFFVAHVGGDGKGSPAQCADFVGRLMDAAGQAFGGLLALGGDHHIGALAGQP